MIRINLLPWRSARRGAQRKYLATLAGMVGGLGLAIVVLVHGVIAGYITAYIAIVLARTLSNAN